MAVQGWICLLFLFLRLLCQFALMFVIHFYCQFRLQRRNILCRDPAILHFIAQRGLPFALPMCLPYSVPGFVSSPIRSSETGEVAASNEFYVLGTS